MACIMDSILYRQKHIDTLVVRPSRNFSVFRRDRSSLTGYGRVVDGSVIRAIVLYVIQLKGRDMSYTELYKVPAKGEIEFCAEFHNASRGAMLVWMNLGKAYGTWGSILMMRPTWDLHKDSRLPVEYRIVMKVTFDNGMVRRENLPRLIMAIRKYAERFDPGTLLEQAEKLEELAQDESCFAVCWNQTSVNADAWWIPDDHPEKGDDNWRRYDISRDTGHWFLFDGMKDF